MFPFRFNFQKARVAAGGTLKGVMPNSSKIQAKEHMKSLVAWPSASHWATLCTFYCNSLSFIMTDFDLTLTFLKNYFIFRYAGGLFNKSLAANG